MCSHSHGRTNVNENLRVNTVTFIEGKQYPMPSLCRNYSSKSSVQLTVQLSLEPNTHYFSTKGAHFAIHIGTLSSHETQLLVSLLQCPGRSMPVYGLALPESLVWKLWMSRSSSSQRMAERTTVQFGIGQPRRTGIYSMLKDSTGWKWSLHIRNSCEWEKLKH